MKTAEMPSTDMMSVTQIVTCAGHQTNHLAKFGRPKIASMLLKGCMSCCHCPVWYATGVAHLAMIQSSAGYSDSTMCKSGLRYLLVWSEVTLVRASGHHLHINPSAYQNYINNHIYDQQVLSCDHQKSQPR